MYPDVSCCILRIHWNTRQDTAGYKYMCVSTLERQWIHRIRTERRRGAGANHHFVEACSGPGDQGPFEKAQKMIIIYVPGNWVPDKWSRGGNVAYKGEAKCNWRRRMSNDGKQIVRLIQYKGKKNPEAEAPQDVPPAPQAQES